MLFAAALTTVILLGYGGYVAWNAVTDRGSSDPSPPAATGYRGAVDNALFVGTATLQRGLDVHLMSDLNPFYAAASEAISLVGADRARLAELATTATGEQADVIASTQQSLDALQEAMTEWRDAVVNLRLASVPDAHAGMDDALARLRSDIERWQALPTDS